MCALIRCNMALIRGLALALTDDWLQLLLVGDLVLPMVLSVTHLPQIAQDICDSSCRRYLPLCEGVPKVGSQQTNTKKLHGPFRAELFRSSTMVKRSFV
jgi:hypothetical protein